MAFRRAPFLVLQENIDCLKVNSDNNVADKQDVEVSSDNDHDSDSSSSTGNSSDVERFKSGFHNFIVY